MVNLAPVGPSKHSIRDAHLKTEMESKEKLPRRVSKHDLKMKKKNNNKKQKRSVLKTPFLSLYRNK